MTPQGSSCTSVEKIDLLERFHIRVITNTTLGPIVTFIARAQSSCSTLFMEMRPWEDLLQ